ncbi:MAG TPA: sugar phosphate isomerase/epimerase family protein [Tepidisphaeraceae bacterium]|jgi:sugar phosphate isomerase/epimerase
MPTISFISANYVARALGYMGPADWMANDAATLAAASPERFLQICQDVAAAGFDAIDIWTAHCHWQHHAGEDYLEQVKGFCSQFDLTITSYAGSFEASAASDVERPFKFMKQLGAPLFAGGIRGPLAPAELCAIVNDVCQHLNVRWGFENHPETSIDQILAKIDAGRHDRVGVALDTGWCGTQGIDALEATRRIHDAGKLFILHLKDVKEPGKHDTCALGDGIVPCEAIVRYLAKAGWQGDIAIEHEPFDRDPMPEIIASHQRVKQWLNAL